MKLGGVLGHVKADAVMLFAAAARFAHLEKPGAATHFSYFGKREKKPPSKEAALILLINSVYQSLYFAQMSG